MAGHMSEPFPEKSACKFPFFYILRYIHYMYILVGGKEGAGGRWGVGFSDDAPPMAWDGLRVIMR